MEDGIRTSGVDLRKWGRVAGFALCLLVFAAIVLLCIDWPFSETAVLKELGEASQTTVRAASYHGTYFPRPGCVLEHVTFQHNSKPGTPPLMIVDSLRIEGSFTGLFTKHLKLIRAGGLQLHVPPLGSEPFQTPRRSSFVIDDLIADGSSLEVASRAPGKQNLRFAFHNFTMHEIGSSGSPASFEANFSNPEPPGEIIAAGKFGPWNESSVGKTPVSGRYSFQNADLGVFGGIAGILSSNGDFSGVLNHVETSGHIDTPEFTVSSSSHKVALHADFEAVVNGENGDTFLKNVSAHFLDTSIVSNGSIAGQENQDGKTATLEFAASNGRIQDLLLLFTRSQRAPMSGAVSFHAKVGLPPGEGSFLEKVELQGDFGIDDGSFNKPNTQADVNRLSRGALGKKGDEPEGTVLSDLRGHVSLKGGTATFSNLSFSVPGAQAQMQGTFSLVSNKINLHGTLTTDSEPANATRGVKTVMLKVLEPFFKKKSRGYAMPVKITGTYRQPSFGLDMSRPEAKHFHQVHIAASKQPS